jgi:hypothetical protein
MGKARLAWDFLKDLILFKHINRVGENFPVIGFSATSAILFLAFSWHILCEIPYFKTFYAWMNVFWLLMLLGALFYTPVYFIHKRYYYTLMYKYAIFELIIMRSLWLLESSLIAFLYIRFNPFVEYRQLLAIVHIAIWVFCVLLFFICFMRSQKASRKLYYEEGFGVVFVDTETIARAAFPPNWTEKLVGILFFPYCFVMVVLMFAKGLIYGNIFMATAFTLASMLLTVLILISFYRLFVILPEVKDATGSEMYADTHNYLINDPQRMEKFFANLHRPH